MMKFLSSLKLAVIVLVALAALIAAGTIIESQLDAEAAQRLVYKSFWMYLVMCLLAVNLSMVMVDRLPWKRAHIPFLLAHSGILILLLGSVITLIFGIDGTLRIPVGESARWVSLPQTEFTVLASAGGSHEVVLFQENIDFFSRDLVSKPLRVPLDEGELVVRNFMPYASASRRIVSSESHRRGAAVRFQIANEQVHLNEWIFQERPQQTAQVNLGPATFFLLKSLDELPKDFLQNPTNAIFISAQKGDRPAQPEGVFFKIFKKNKNSVVQEGFLRVGEEFDTGWMNLKFKLIQFFPFAEEKWDYKALDRPSPMSTSVVEIVYKEQSFWLQLGEILRIFSDKAGYLVSYSHQHIDLGFDVQLKKFEMGHYPGTSRPSFYKSFVEIPQGGEFMISMNEPLKYNQYKFYQASFEEGPKGPTASVLSVNVDPGRWLKYLGSFLLSLGMVWLFYDRRSRTRKVLKVPTKVSTLMSMTLFFFCLTLSIAALSSNLKEIPIQDGGRIKPFDTFARESLSLIYGKNTFQGRPASDIVMTWILSPSLWQEKSFVMINHPWLKEALKLDSNVKYFSPQVIFQSERLSTLFQELQTRRERREKLDVQMQALQRLEQQLMTFREITSGQAIKLIPSDSMTDTSWKNINEMDPERSEAFSQVAHSFMKSLGVSQGPSDPTSSPKLTLNEAVEQFIQKARKINTEIYPSEKLMNWEVHYNEFHPFLWAWMGYLLTSMSLILLWIFKKNIFYYLSWGFVNLGLLFHIYAFGLRVYLTGRAPVSNMYETVVFVGFGAVIFSIFIEFFYKKKYSLFAGSVVGFFCLLLSDMAPLILDPSLKPLEPVLRSNFWLTVHVLTITISYAAFFLAFALGNIGLFFYLRNNEESQQALILSLYRALQIGVGLLAPGIILGGVWADYSWGRFWGWDPKETWALIVLLAYMAVIHGRISGMIKNFGLMVSAVVSFSLVIMAWYGVNYILGAGLHSYGFGAGGVEYVASFLGVQFLFVIFVVLVRQERHKKGIQ